MPQIYKPNTASVTVLGEAYTADENGIIDIPDDKFSPTVFSQGFVSAIGRINQLAREAAVADTANQQTKPVIVEESIAPPPETKATLPINAKKLTGDTNNV